MSSGFSAAVKIGDLDDFLSPAADCVILPAEPKKATSGSVIKSDKENKTASITLSDCLACSGCVTSAETLLLQSQSVDELLSSSSQASHSKVVFSISSASRRALSEYLQVRPRDLCQYLETMLASRIKNATVVHLSVAEAIVLQETVEEFKSRRPSGQPLLTSHCPGWTCYATKVVDESILPLLSRVKSPEQVAGMILKRLLPGWESVARLRQDTRPSFDSYRALLRYLFPLGQSQSVYHVLISPCFDKKLEIIRPDYAIHSQRCVDLVLSSTELLDLLTRPETINASPVSLCKLHGVLGLRDSWAPAAAGCESGGYAQTAALEEEVEWKRGKNSDLLEFKMYLRSNGFRNIQNVTRRIKTGKLASKFVEIMACPGGCDRGGGQPEKRIKKIPSSLWAKLLSYIEFPANRVDGTEVDFISSPVAYSPAIVLRQHLANMFGSEDHFQSAVRTEWKSLLSGPDKDITVSSLKW